MFAMQEIALVVFVLVCLIVRMQKREHEECSPSTEKSRGPDQTLTLSDVLKIEILGFCQAREVALTASVSSDWQKRAISDPLWSYLIQRDYSSASRSHAIRSSTMQTKYSIYALTWMKKLIGQNAEWRIGLGDAVYDLSRVDNCPCTHVVLDRYAGQIVPAIDFDCVRHSAKAIKLMKSATVAISPQTGALDTVRRQIQTK